MPKIKLGYAPKICFTTKTIALKFSKSSRQKKLTGFFSCIAILEPNMFALVLRGIWICLFCCGDRSTNAPTKTALGFVILNAGFSQPEKFCAASACHLLTWRIADLMILSLNAGLEILSRYATSLKRLGAFVFCKLDRARLIFGLQCAMRANF